jgi:hypothetical protein
VENAAQHAVHRTAASRISDRLGSGRSTRSGAIAWLPRRCRSRGRSRPGEARQEPLAGGGDLLVELARPRLRALQPALEHVAPVLGVELPPVDCDELDVRLPLTAFLRPFNVIGWAALAIGDLQLVAPRDEVVLAAGLAWEAATA